MDMLNAFMWKFLFPSVVLVVPEDPMVLCPCQLPAALGSGHHLSWFLCKTGWKSSPRVQSVPSQRGHAGSLGDDTSAVCRLCKSCGGKEGEGCKGASQQEMSPSDSNTKTAVDFPIVSPHVVPTQVLQSLLYAPEDALPHLIPEKCN